MLFGLLKSPRKAADLPAGTPPARGRSASGIHRVAAERAPLTLLDPSAEDEFSGIDRLDREELDEV